jgi:tripartite-type tricarboxylate transporter receptor subunit TctC
LNKIVCAFFVALSLALTAGSSFAQAFPERPIRIIVPLPPGGSPDAIARALGQGLQTAWPQPVIVENRPGGAQNIGSDAVAKSAPDGYTWLIAPGNVVTVNPYLGTQSFDPLNDLLPVTMVAVQQFLLVVHPSVPATNVKELIALARAKPGELNYGSSGSGSVQHMGTSLFMHMTGTKMNHVPYKGAAPALADLLPGRIQVWFGAANTLLPHVREGRLRALGGTAAQRYPTVPDVPSIAEAGVPGYVLDPWIGLFLPAKTSPEIVRRINAETAKILNAPDLKAKLAAQGIDLVTNSQAEFARFVREDNVKWGKLIKDAGIKGE